MKTGEIVYSENIIVSYPVMTKREMFAAMAMQGMLANNSTTNLLAFTMDGCIAESVRHADALIKELEK